MIKPRKVLRRTHPGTWLTQSEGALVQRLIYVTLLVLFSCLLVQAEEIQLKDGSKVNGRIIAVNGDTFQVKTAYGEIQVPRQQIVAISFPENEPNSAASESAGDAPRLIDESLGVPPIRIGRKTFE